MSVRKWFQVRILIVRRCVIIIRREGFSAFVILGRCVDNNGCQQSDLVFLFETLKPSQAIIKPELKIMINCNRL
jgi:hypothetical protein